ncbi:leucyl aminopeptidase [Candidatus Dependentiae bacterium]|nr:leucyl aminopeptidase [Candidatus Dependentiae bacterium]
MIKLSLAELEFWSNACEGFVFFLGESLDGFSNNPFLDHIEKNFYPQLKAVLKINKFEGKKGQIYVLTIPGEDQIKQFIFAGIGKAGKKSYNDLETLRRAVGQVILTLKRLTIENAIFNLPNEDMYKINTEELLKQVAVAALMTSYEFTTFKSNKDQTVEWNGNLLIKVSDHKKGNFSSALQHAIVIGEAINQARHWCDLPANVLTPTYLNHEAEKIATEHHLTFSSFGREKAEELGMGGFLAVGAGSAQESKFVILEYKTKAKNAPTIALAGKGITFDTGGISLKPSNSMHGMKYDMSGAAAVIATLKIIAQLKPEVNVVALAPLVENMPDGKAQRQDDIIRFMNGKTAEIKSTDAEGRLVLADALCYAEKFYSPETIIDIATLTGACLYALGYFYTGLMTQDDTLLEVLPKIGFATGDRTWPLPLDEDFRAANNSPVADLRNTGSDEYKAGTITAGWFLQEFVKNARWAHLDIAGTADGVPGISYLGKTSAGASIRLLVEFIMNYQQYMGLPTSRAED